MTDYPYPRYPKQQQSMPGCTEKMEPVPDHGETTYRGSGRLAAGVSKDDADTYAEGVRRGGTLVSARVQDADHARLDAILDQSAVNLQNRRVAWQKAGWVSYDPSAEPYSAEQVRQERDLYRGR